MSASPPAVLRGGRGRWFVRGWLAGVMLWAAANAASYFARSDSWGDLLGTHPERMERIGFPLEIWERRAAASFQLEFRNMLGTIGAGIGFGALAGLVAMLLRSPLNRRVAPLEQRLATESEVASRLQFSLRGLLLTTTLVAVLATFSARLLRGRPEALGLIYLFGPWVLVALAMLPRRLRWQDRVLLLIPLAALVIGGALWIGGSLRPPRLFEDVLLGIFVSWTLQSTLAALLLIAVLLVCGPRLPAAGGRS